MGEMLAGAAAAVTPFGLNLHYHYKQFLALITSATELLYGGAAGGGKSHLMRQAAILWCSEIAGLQVYVFRRIEDDLIKNHMEGPKGFRNMLAPWVKAGWCTIIETEIRFWNGSKIFLCHCKDEKHRFKYHGAEIHVLMIDELTTFTEIIYRYLRFRLRMVGIELPKKYRKGEIGPSGTRNAENLFPRVLCSSNPGNIGHHWVKRTFGLEKAAGIAAPTRMPDIEGGLIRQYIPAVLDDNPSMADDDPNYRARMRGLGDPSLVKAMELGDWNIVAGGFFPEFSLARHVIKAQTLPPKLFSRCFRAGDWGSARPFSTGFYGIADDDWKTTGVLGNPILVPRGALVRFREWYGAKENADNIGLKMSAESWAMGVLKRSLEEFERYRYTVVDTSMWDEDGGPSLAEKAEAVKLNGKSLNLRRADKRREPGWAQMRARLNPDIDDPTAPPMLFVMDNQPHAIRIIQAVQHDETYIEDLDTDGEDHAVDEIRYACMSRPRPIANAPSEPRKPKGPTPWTMEWLIQQTERERPSVSRYPIE
jgi:hypothetical protein